MKIIINIKKRYFITFLCLFLILGIVLIINAYGGSNPSVMGHTWGEIECPGCITTADIGDGQVQTADIGDGQVQTADIGDNQITTQKIADGQVQTADIGDSQVTNAKINSTDWSKLTNRPAGLDDGDNPTCNWAGMVRTKPCVSCGGGGEECFLRDSLQINCNDGRVTSITTDRYCCTVCGYYYCPFIYSWNGWEYVFETTILYKIDSEDKEAVQYRELESLDTSNQIRAKIVEEEQETSYIDSIQIVITDTTAKGGEEVTVLNPISASRELFLISESDDRYLMMEYGDEVYVEFEQAPELKEGYSRKIEVKAEGYYIFQ